MRPSKRRCAISTAVSGLVHSLDQITRLLKFNREEVRCRDVHSLQVDARLVRTARSYLIGPEGQSGGIRQAIQEVIIMLPYKESCLIDRIRSRRRKIVIKNRHRRRRPGTKSGANRITQRNAKRLSPFLVSIIDYQDRETLARLTRSERKRPRRKDVIPLLRRRAIGC